MTFYSQTNYNDQLGTGKYTIKQAGCKLTCVADMVDIPPDQLNQIFKDNGVYADNTGNLSDQAIANFFKDKLEYDGYTTQNPNHFCMVETNFYSNKGYPQHFFLLLDDGMIYDPLLETESTNHYENNMVSFRLFKPKQGDNMPFSDEEMYNTIDATIHDFLGYQATPDQIRGHLAAMKERQKDGPYCGSEFIHDRYKEMPPKDCSKELTELNAKLNEACEKQVNQEVNVAIAKTRKEDSDKVKGLIDPKDCPKTPETNCNWLCKLLKCCK